MPKTKAFTKCERALVINLQRSTFACRKIAYSYIYKNIHRLLATILNDYVFVETARKPGL